MDPLNTSINFEFVRRIDSISSLFPTLHEAEILVELSPSSSLMQCRVFAELYTRQLCQQDGHYMTEGRNFIDDLAYLERTDQCNRETLKWLHEMRKDGNDAAHRGQRDTNVAKARLRDAWRLCKQVAREHGIETNVNSFNIDVNPITLHGQHMSEEMQEIYKRKLDTLRHEVNRRQDREVTLKALWPERTDDREDQKQLVEEQVIDYVSKAQVHFSLPTFQTMFQDGAAEIREAAAIHHEQRIEELREAKDLQLHKKDAELRELTKRQLEIADEMSWTCEYPRLEHSDAPDWDKVPGFMEQRLLEQKPPFMPCSTPPREIDTGGWSKVYSISPRGGSVTLAVKIPKIPETESQRSHLGQVWIDETKAARKLAILHTSRNIKGIIKPVQLPTNEDTPGYIIYERAVGTSLNTRLASGPIDFLPALHICSEICLTLHALNSGGYAYTDIKADNIVVSEEGVPTLIDPSRLFPRFVRPPEWTGFDPIQIITNTNNPAFKSGQCYLLGHLLLHMLKGGPSYWLAHLFQGEIKPNASTSLDEWNRVSSQAHESFASSPELSQTLQTDISETIARSIERIPDDYASNNERVAWKETLLNLLNEATASDAAMRADRGWNPNSFGSKIRKLYDPKGIIGTTSSLT